MHDFLISGLSLLSCIDLSALSQCLVVARQFCMELNGLAVRLQEECKPEECTQMTATEQWIFLCAAHKTPKEVRHAINYTHALCLGDT